MFAFFVVILIALIYMLSLGKPGEKMKPRAKTAAKVKFNDTTAVRIFDNDNIIQNTTSFLNDSVA